MAITNHWRRLAMGVLSVCAVAVVATTASIAVDARTPAMAQTSEEFQIALGPYGAWRKHAKFGEVWVPTGRPRDWHPYEYGHWVYTDEWGWYWVSDDAERDWGWVTYHYGRWIHDRGAWFWVPGEQWAPAWVDWRYGDEYIGWAALPPDDLIDAYAAAPALWIFVAPRFMTAPQLRSYIVAPQRRAAALRATRLVNRTMAVQGARIGVNPGLAPAFVARVTRAALPAYRVSPRVFGATQGVSGAVQVRREDLRGDRAKPGAGNHVNAISVQRTSTVIQPVASAPAPQALGKGERGRLGTHPPRAAQGGAAAPPPQQPKAAPPQQQTPAPPRPAAAPQPKTPAPPAAAPRTPAAAPPAARPPVAAPSRQGEPPPQAKPARPIAPQTPPPPPPAQSGSRQSPPAAARPAPPPRPVPPAVKPAPPPDAPTAKKPGEKPDEKK